MPDAASQLQLCLTYRALAHAGGPLPALGDVGFQAFSQVDEDGILLFIFSLIGTTSKICVEMCAGAGDECNTANLIINHGWTGWLFDGDADNVEQGRRSYATIRQTYVHPPTFVHAWITRGNVNELLGSHGLQGEVDLLSLDMDGVDYWIWDALDAIEPRVVVVEYQDILGPERSLTVPYSDDFAAADHPMTGVNPDFAGASLLAFAKLARERGYRLVGCNRLGYNAFFVRKPIAEDLLPEIAVEACFSHPKVLAGMKERYPKVAHLGWVEV